ncbi:MAG TPA: T9SS type A sorting domain-containing protein, partial [Rubricoccaceae bacterium]|nr:T9SS type A sorting domain-containing protein [Rubricoccaceae bacterium]
SAGSNDVYVVTIDDCLVRVCGDANEPGATDRPVLLTLASANPARNHVALSLTLDRPQPTVAEVFDTLGRRVALAHEGSLGAGTHRLMLDTRGWPPGTYLVRVQAGRDGTTRTARFTLVR